MYRLFSSPVEYYVVCKLQTGACLIGGQCYADGALDDNNKSQMCNVALSNSTWSAGQFPWY